jgi:hypothetical protein
MIHAPMIGRLLLCLAAVMAIGCESPSRTTGPDVMGGMTLEIFEAHTGGSYALYRVETDGTLRFAGGLDAQQGRFTWDGPLTAEEREQLLELLRRHGWFATEPPSTGEPPGTTYRVRIDRRSQPSIRRRWRIRGETPAVTEVADLLEQASRRRNEEFLRALPQPSRQP